MSIPDYASRKTWKELGFTIIPGRKPFRVENIRCYTQDDLIEFTEEYLLEHND